MKRYETKMTSDKTSHHMQIATIEKMGEEGWELKAVVIEYGFTFCYFQRERVALPGEG